MDATINAFDALVSETATVRVVWHRMEGATAVYSHECFDSLSEAEPFASLIAKDDSVKNPYVVAGGRVHPARALKWRERGG